MDILTYIHFQIYFLQIIVSDKIGLQYDYLNFFSFKYLKYNFFKNIKSTGLPSIKIINFKNTYSFKILLYLSLGSFHLMTIIIRNVYNLCFSSLS